MAVYRNLLCLVVVCCFLMVASSAPEQPPAPPSNFVSSLTSRVREAEPIEMREYRTSCIREPGCRWKCAEGSRTNCTCVCGAPKNKKNNSRNWN